MVSTSSTKNLQKAKTCYFQTPTIFVLELKEASNHFLRKFLWPNFNLNSFWCFASLSQKMVSTSSLKNCKKLKISFSKCSEHSFYLSRLLQNHFLKSLLWPTLNLNVLEGTVSLSQKTVSTSSLKNFQKLKRLRTFVFELKIASKPFSYKLPMIKFWLK